MLVLFHQPQQAHPDEVENYASRNELCVALHTAAASGAAVSRIAANSASAKVSSSVVVSKAASSGLWAAAAKSLAIGVAAGFAVMGAGAVVERLSRSDAPPAISSKRTLAPTAHRPFAGSIATRIAAQPGNSVVVPVPSLPGATPGFSTPSKPFSTRNSALNQAGRPSRAPAASRPPDTASLSQQARELAELKRLIDRGAAVEALRRLDADFSSDAVSALSEERDALYAQALDRAHRVEEARLLAHRFLDRYPHSPYCQAMRQLLAE